MISKRYIKDSITRFTVKSFTLTVFIAIGLIAISTFYTSRYAFVKTVVKVPVYLVVNQGTIFRCNNLPSSIECFSTNITEEDLFKNKQAIGKITEEANFILRASAKNYAANVCEGYYKKCSDAQIAAVEKDIFNQSLFNTELKQNALSSVYVAFKNSIQRKLAAQRRCTLFENSKKHSGVTKKTNVPCSLGFTEYSLTGSLLLQNVYNNISFTEEGAQKLDFFNYFISFAKSSHGIKNWPDFRFLTNTNSVHPDSAGIKDSLYGSFATIAISLIVSIVIATLAAMFLEEFQDNKRSFIRRFIIVNIDNMSAIPSVLCGLLGAVFYINILHLPRSSILVGAFTISFMIFPLIVISARNAIRSVPQDIKDLAYSMGASQYRVAFCHTLPMAMNGIITGALLTVGKAAGETACLLIVGLTAFNTEVPKSILDSTSTIATQVYTWIEMPDTNFKYRIYAGMSLLILISFSISFIVRTTRYFSLKSKQKK